MQLSLTRSNWFTLRSVASTVLLILLLALMTSAQPTYDGATPAGLSRGNPAGSYALSGFDNVNLFNGHMNFHLPLLTVGGRGNAGHTVMLPIEQVWTSQIADFNGPTYAPNYNWWDGIKPGYGPGVLQSRSMSEGCGEVAVVYGTTRLTFALADGTEIDLIDQQYGGQPIASSCEISPFDWENGTSRGTIWVTRDGTSATFISDQPIKDTLASTFGPWVRYPSGYLRLADGTTYRIDQGHVQWLRDRNGNRINFTYTNGILTLITDSLNRQVAIEYNVQDGTYGLCDRITFKGFGGTTRTLRVLYKDLADALDAGQSLKTYSGTNGLFPGMAGSSTTLHNPRMTSGVVLPDGRSYQFRYSSYGELTKVTLPTGGVFTYEWGPGVENAGPGGGGPINQIYRRVLEKRIYTDNGTTLASLTTFGRYDNIYGPEGSAWIKQHSIDGYATVISQSKHYFHSGPMAHAFDTTMWLPDQLNGKEKKTEHFDQTGSTVLERTTSTWTYGGTLAGTSINPRVSETVKTIEPSAANLVSKQTFSYDSYNNKTDVYEYGFNNGSPGALVRRTHSEYLTTNPVNGQNYATNTNIHLRSVQKKRQVFEGSVLRFSTTFEYDNYATDTNHASLVNRENISGLDAAFTTTYGPRGNVTAATKAFLNTSGQETGSVSAYAQYDIAGNVVKTIDEGGNSTALDYSDRYGTPDANAQTNSGSTELGSQISYALPTKVTNALGHNSYSQFDYYLGKPVNVEDANTIVSSFHYGDGLDRLTQIKRAIDTDAANQTSFTYEDGNRTITTVSDLNAFNDGLIIQKMLYDGLGRTIENRQFEGGTNYISIQKQYDALGRPFKTSNPFRPPGESDEWTEQAFDALGRIVSVKTPDNAVVSTTYSGNTVTVTDPAGKSRKSVTDALGRLIEVYEDPNGLNFLTSYTYDVVDNLRKVTQGSQQRFFMYDSLKRLIRIRNPEQGTLGSLSLLDPLTGNSTWSNGYQYDATGNLIQRTDTRGVVSTYAYDALNRNTIIQYRINGQPDPNTGDVEFLYDDAANGKGRLWKTYKWGTKPSNTTVGSYDPLGRITQFYNLFGDGQGGWSPGFEINRTYNRAGKVTSQSYPSENSVTYSYDVAGRINNFAGNLGDGVARTYASSFNYNARNQTTQELFGTQTPLYHKLQYNIRGQLWDVRVATGSDVNGSWDRGALQFFYESTLTHGASGPDNNGNVLKSSHYVPNDQQQALAIPHQLYTYDALNRLASTAEYFISDFQTLTQTSLQTYSYDRWGNRTIDVTHTWGTGINNKEFTVDPNDTNRLLAPSGQGVMSYDSAGNLTNDTYTGAGARTYDAENRIVSAAGNMGQTSLYTYNAAGQRVRRQVGTSPEEWQIYGIDGELLAEYPANGDTENPRKEYGYRNGQLLITGESSSTRTNLALAANGATATASSQISGNYPASSTINGDRRGLNWNFGGGWNDATVNTHPDWLEINFNGSKTIDEINVFTLQDNPATPAEPTESMTFTLYGLTGYSVQYWNGSAWVTVTGGTVSGNNKVWKKFTFTPITTTKIRVFTSSSPDAYSRITEVEAWGNGAAPPPRTNFALGGTTSASSTYSANYPAVSTINGDRRGLNWNFGGGWNDATVNTHPDWLEINFNGNKTIDEINVITLQDTPATPAEPTESMTFTLYGLTGYSVQYWNGSAWTTIPGGTVTGNNKVWKKFTFTAITTTKIRVLTSSSPDAYSRITEVEAWGPTQTGAATSIKWLVPDHLGTPRIIVDQTGNLAGIKRHDYLPFGEELFAGTGGRTAAMGYVGDGVRQQFTSKERDVETGLDYFSARYFGSTQGRFTSPDPLNASGRPTKPQSWNRYSYVLNRPLALIDPNGLHDCTPKTPCVMTTEDDAEAKTRANPSLALIQEQVTVTSERQPISTTAIEIFNSSITPRATEPTIPIEQGSLYAGQFSAAMQQRAEPMAQVLTVAAVVATAEIALPVIALEAAGAGVTTLGLNVDTAVIGAEANTAVYVGQAGFNVLRSTNWGWEAVNLPWLNSVIRAGQSVIVLGGNKYTQQEVQYLIEQGKYMWNSGFDKLVPPH